MDTAGGHRLIRVNQAARCADPGARGVVIREEGVPRASPWLSLSLPSSFIIGPPVNMPESGGGHRREGRNEERWLAVVGAGRRGAAAAVSFSVQVETRRRRQTRINTTKGEGGINKNKETRFEER